MNRLHPLSAVSMALQRGVTGFSMPFFVVMILSSFVDAVDIGWVFWLAPIGLVVGVGYGLAYYYRFTYAITADTFDVTSGVFSRRSREIPYRRIQNVDVSQGVLQRVLGLAVVSIETAGGGDTEATLNYVAEDEAERLRSEIRRLTAGAEEPPVDGPTDSAAAADTSPAAEPGPDDRPRDADTPIPLFDLEFRELVLYATTSFRWGAAIFPVMLVVFLQSADSDSQAGAVPAFVFDVAHPFGGPASLDGAAVGPLLVLIAITALQWAAVTYVASAIYTVANYYGFHLGRAGDDFVYERGLIQRYSGSIPVEKVQSVTVTENPLQRLVGYAGLWVETAGYGPDSGGGSQSAVPLAGSDRVYRFAETLTGIESPRFRSPPTLARRRYLVRYAIIGAILVAAAAGLAQVSSLERWYVAAIVFVAVPPAAHLRYVNLGYAVGDDHLVIRTGFWKRRTTVIPYYRIQTVSTRRSIFQRRLGLASLVVDTASSRTFSWGMPTIYDVDLETARELQGTGRERLQSALRERARGDDLGLSVDFT
ncbi:PH domain-containing protein [Natrinema longum]|uniref:PH domain-containing protein n=1 Tax=Natrinema longum TaxID=370324 RepID=A0A8A2U9T8_9EURY|nr:PH domain-containing protein [Natrinema longum]MBZ6496709.1 PH domain-containing protein [Natrinema longum]QSW85397.1 PH domain-containing protein [Natrinema longum]